MTRRHRWFNLAPAPAREGVRAVVTDAATPELYIYDIIDSWGGEWGVSAADVLDALEQIGDVPALSVRISSPGGDYFEGVAIYNALVRHGATVTVHVDSLAASAASVIAMAGDQVIMGQGAQMMIHEASSIAFGTADDMRRTATMLDQTNDDIAGFYAAKAGGDVAAWRAAVAAETWYTAAQAVEAGLADALAERPGQGAPPPAEEPAEPPAGPPAARLREQPAQNSACTCAPDVSTSASTETQTSDAPAPDAPPAAELPPAAAQATLSELICSALSERRTA